MQGALELSGLAEMVVESETMIILETSQNDVVYEH